MRTAALLSIVAQLLMLTHSSDAQTELPNTDIYLLEISQDKKQQWVFQNPMLITKNDKYDNQPWWSPDGTYLLYSSVRDTFKPDIYRYSLADRKTSVIINTPQTAEYSPVMMPDKVNISVVQVSSNDSAQVLAKCDNKTDECVNLLPKVNGLIGYYVWIDGSRVALYMLGDPATLQIANLSTNKIDTIAEDVGRCIQKVPGKNAIIAYVDKSSNPWSIKVYDAKSGKTTSVVKTLEEDEDFCFMPDGSLLMGHGSELYRYVPPPSVIAPATRTGPTQTQQDKKESDKDEKKFDKKNPNAPWELVADFDGMPVEYFYRLAVSPKGDLIAIVTYEDEKP